MRVKIANKNYTIVYLEAWHASIPKTLLKHAAFSIFVGQAFRKFGNLKKTIYIYRAGSVYFFLYNVSNVWIFLKKKILFSLHLIWFELSLEKIFKDRIFAIEFLFARVKLCLSTLVPPFQNKTYSRLWGGSRIECIINRLMILHRLNAAHK